MGLEGEASFGWYAAAAATPRLGIYLAVCPVRCLSGLEIGLRGCGEAGWCRKRLLLVVRTRVEGGSIRGVSA